MKRFLAMLLAVVMVVSVLPLGVWAEGSGTPAPQGEMAAQHTRYAIQQPHDHTAGTDAHICEHCVAKGLTGDAAKPAWTAWSGTTLPKTTGHYYITGNLSNMTKAQIDTGSEDIVICLNGKTLTAKDWNNFYQLGGANKVTVLDCTAHEENGTYVAGKLSGATQSTVMFAYKKNLTASFTMYDGIITNSTRKEKSGTKNGGAIAMQGGCTVNLYGGEISDCRANNGAAIFIQNTAATLNIDGAVIKNNTAITSGSAIYGNTDTWTGAGNNTITIKNTVITDNDTETAGDTGLGAIYINNANQDDASLTFGGNCQITGNTDKDGKEYNLFLHNSAGKQMKFAVDGLSTDAKIGVRVAGDRLTAADGLTISKTLTADCSGNFQCNNTTHEVKYENNVLVLKTKPGHIHKVCDGDDACADCAHTDVTYLPWGETAAERTSLPDSGNYYLTNDVTLSAQKNMNGGELNLCLNGYSIKAASGKSIRFVELQNSAKLRISNCEDVKESKITGARDGAIFAKSSGNASAAIELYNIIMEDNTRYSGGGAVMTQNGCSLVAVSCKFYNNRSANNGGGAIRQYSNSTMKLVGCTFERNDAPMGSALRLDRGSATLIDTVIENNTTTAANGGLGAVYFHAEANPTNVVIAGETRIVNNNVDSNGVANNLYLRDKTAGQPVLTLDGLSGNAKIGITLDGARLAVAENRYFTGDLGNTYPVDYFGSDNDDYIVIRKAGKLVLEEKAKAHEHGLCKADNCTCGNHEKMRFSPWGETAAERTSLPTSGYYYLTEDVTLESRATMKGTSLNLCLNGHTVSVKDGVSTSHFLLQNSAKLNITNCSETKEGILTGAKSCAIQIYDTSAVELYNVVLEDNKNEGTGQYDGGGAVQLFNSATLKAVSCKFRNNTSAKSAGAVLLRGNDNQVTLTNCEVKGNKASTTSAIRANKGSRLILDNTVVENNQNTSTSEYNYGAVFAEHASSALTVQGATRITGNKNGNGEPANVYLQNKTDNQPVITVGEQGLSGDAMIGVTMQSGRLEIADGRVVSAKLNGKDVAAFFHYDSKAYETLVKDDFVIVEENSNHRHCLCNTENCTEHEKLKFLEWSKTDSLPPSGNYCLMKDVVLSGGHYIRGDLNLCLHGHSISLKDGVTGVPVFYMKAGDLSITDCKDTGKITGGVKNYGGVINVINGATFNLYGGTLTGGKVVDMDNDKGKGGAIYLSKSSDGKAGGVFNMYGGTISGNEAYRGGGVYMCDGSAMNMYGGTISGNTATYRGGAITNDGVVSLNIYGGTITDNTAVSGAAVYLCNGATMTMSGGEITKNTTTGVGGAILVESAGSKLVVTGGKFAENSSDADGGAIYASRNTVLEISGGSIENNQAVNGGGIYLNETNATISGGSVKGNQAAEEGGGIAIKNAKANLSGGEISGNTAKKLGGGVFAEGGTTTLSGDLVIRNNQAEGKNANLYLPGKAVFSVGTMGANAEVGISAEKVYGVMSAQTDKDCSAAFRSDNSALKVVYKDKTVHLEPVEGHTHCLCSDRSTVCKHEAVTFGPWTDATKLPREGNFYLTTDVVLSSAAYAAADLNLCLNGHTISMKKGVEDRIINMKAGATLSIADCKDTGKITGGVHNYGGVINVNAGSTMNLYGGNLTGNKVVDLENDRGKAGAIYLSKADGEQPGGVFNMYGGSVSGNEAYRGGAVYMCEGSVMNLYGGTLAENTATYRGGAITNDNVVTLNIHGGTITGNKAKNGAAVFLCGGATMTMTGGEMTNHVSNNAGGVILMESKDTKLFMKGGKIANNTSTSDGTIYVSRNTYFEMTGGSIENNKAKNGAGIYVNESTAKIGGTIKGNKATGSGAGVFFLNPIDGEITGGSITNNQCDSYGAGVYIYNHSTATISGGNISYNTAVKGAGGGVCMMGGSLNLKGGTIGYNQNLHKSNKGGGIMMYGGTLTMTGGYIVGNKVQEGVSGAGICCTTIGQTKNGVKTDRPSKITMYGGTIADHVGNYGGAVILQSKTVMNVYGGTFRNNEAKGDGGAIYLNGKSVLNVYNATMVDNKAANRGGAICYFANTTGEITGGTIKNNYAGGYGGNIAAHGLNTKITIKNMTFTGGESGGYGGSISVSWNAAMDMVDCEIYENKAVKGGAMYLAHKTTCNLDNVKIYKNSSTETGGGVYLDVGNNINFTNVKLMDNEAGTSGGAIYTRANLHLKDCLIDGNSAGQDGGGIATGGAFTYGHTFTNGYVGRGQGLIIENTKVTNNKSVGNGGGVCMNKQNWNTVINSEFTGNTSGMLGSGLYVADDLMTKGTVLISGNTSKTDGYAVYFNENSYDGQSHTTTMHEIGGNLIVKDNVGGEVMLCKDVVLGTTTEGYGQDTYFNITLSDGVLTNRVLGEYHYEGGDLNYTVTYGSRSLTEPEVDTARIEANEPDNGNVWLYAGVGAFAVAVIAVVVIILLKKKKAGKPAEAPQE